MKIRSWDSNEKGHKFMCRFLKHITPYSEVIERNHKHSRSIMSSAENILEKNKISFKRKEFEIIAETTKDTLESLLEEELPTEAITTFISLYQSPRGSVYLRKKIN